MKLAQNQRYPVIVGNWPKVQLHSKREKLAIAMQGSGASKSTSKKTSKTAMLAVDDVLETVTKCLDDSKAEDLVTINITDKSALADYMVIATGRSNRHVSAIADHLLRELKNTGSGSAKVEGLQSADWVLIDTGDIIVHLFRPEVREFYALEKMWQVPASDDVN
ncbi:MAG: ribosome silencing factor [Pseudomonadota bacterium]